MKALGLVGAHRVGKTTLAKHAAGISYYHFVEVSISGMQKQRGFDSSNQDYDLSTRQEIQEGLLHDFEALLDRVSRLNKLFITDRTPLDLIGYALLHVGNSATAEQSAWILDYIQRCIKVTNKYYEKVVLVQPGVELVHSSTSAAANYGVIEHLNAIYTAYLIDPRLACKRQIIPREVLNLNDRVHYIFN